MDQTALVAADFTAGLKLVQSLDRSALSIGVALWLYSPEHEDWRFVLASRRVDEVEPSEAYGLVHDALTAAGVSLEQTPALLILKILTPSFVHCGASSRKRRALKECAWEAS